MRISDWSSDVCSSDLRTGFVLRGFECRTVQRVECSFRICGLQAGRGSMQHQPVLYLRYRRSAVLLARMPFDPANKILAHRRGARASQIGRSEEHTSELQSLMRISYAVFFLKKKHKHHTKTL